MTPLRVFIGSGETSLVERKTLIHSLRQHATSPLDISVFNGTYDTIERAAEPPRSLSVPLALRAGSATEFSIYRFLIPELCGFAGRAVYLDSDILALADVAELFALPMNGHAVLASTPCDNQRNLGVMLIDCGAWRIAVPALMEDLAHGRYRLEEVKALGARFMAHNVPSFSVGELPAQWNALDVRSADTKLLHYTKVRTQPWRRSDHPYGDVWFAAFKEAYARGDITRQDLRRAHDRGGIRSDLRRGNEPPLLPMFWKALRRRLNAKLRRADQPQ